MCSSFLKHILHSKCLSYRTGRCFVGVQCGLGWVGGGVSRLEIGWGPWLGWDIKGLRALARDRGTPLT